MFERFTSSARQAVLRAQAEARELRHPEVGAALRIREQPGPQDPRPPSQRMAASSRRGTCWSSWTTPSTSPRHVPRWPNSS